MRLWSLHPQYLDTKGLLALWREGLLAQAVLAGKTKGYTHHPQLERFKDHKTPLKALGTYLHFIVDEAERRAYHFDREKILAKKNSRLKITVTKGQLLYEWEHLLLKLKKRDKALFFKLRKTRKKISHPLFRPVHGKIESWERLT